MGSKGTEIAGATGVALRVFAGITLLVMLAVNWVSFRFVNESAYDWRRWFAWHPVRIGGRTYWLTHVERSLSYTPGLISFKAWQYRKPGTAY